MTPRPGSPNSPARGPAWKRDAVEGRDPAAFGVEEVFEVEERVPPPAVKRRNICGAPGCLLKVCPEWTC